jgi:hypothetical protein
MKRAVILGVMLAAGCRVTNDPQLKEHVATCKKQMAELRATAEALVQKNQRCPTKDEVPRVTDPWGRLYIVVCPGQKGHAADVVSRGADGDIGTSDDVRSWDD